MPKPDAARDPRGALEALGAVWSPDADAYLGGELDASKLRCLMCQHAPCRCEALGLTFGSAAYFARLDAIHGRTRPAPATCSAPECPLTAQVGEHPGGVAIASSGPRDALGRPGLPASAACIAEVQR
jgi:hypothetical protein